MSEQYSSLSLFYDAFMQDVDYGAWCDFYEECFRKFSTVNVERIVDIGCGTGSITVPMAARVSQKVGQAEDPGNFLLMHAMGPNVAGVIGSAVAAGVLLSCFR